jgi:hypothetical protein
MCAALELMAGEWVEQSWNMEWFVTDGERNSNNL